MKKILLSISFLSFAFFASAQNQATNQQKQQTPQPEVNIKGVVSPRDSSGTESQDMRSTQQASRPSVPKPPKKNNK